MARRIKGAKSLYTIKHQEVIDYDRMELITLLANKKVHSPELSETDEENDTTRNICVYDLSWRSDKVLYLIFVFFLYIFDTYIIIYYFILVKATSL